MTTIEPTVPPEDPRQPFNADYTSELRHGADPRKSQSYWEEATQRTFTSFRTRTEGLGLDFEASRQDVIERLKDNLFLDDDDISIGERLSCYLENIVATYAHAYFRLLAFIAFLFTLGFGFLWYETRPQEEDDWSIWIFFYFSFQQIATGGMDTSIDEIWRIIIHITMCLFGLIVFAVLVGMITEAFAEQAEQFKLGKTKVSDKNHTLVLGWNEATIRLVCQIAFLRQQWRLQNETWSRRIFWWTRVEPSTPVAKSTVVIMCNNQTKEDMQARIEAAFIERGLCNNRTRVGWDIICRVGDPTNVGDLQRVGAHRATAIVLQMTEGDTEEADLHGGVVQNGVTLRTLLSLRAVLFRSRIQPDWENLRIVVQLSSPSKAIEAVTFQSPSGQPLVLVQDLSVFLNSLMFTCIAQQGLAEVLLDLLGFDEEAMRARDVVSFPESTKQRMIGKTIHECAFLWEDGIVLGVIGGETIEKHTGGIAPIQSEYRIQESDRIAFVSKKTIPELADVNVADAQRLEGRFCFDQKCPHHVLVCGWRQAWTEEPLRFAGRLWGVCKDMAPGSSITFLNMVKPIDFQGLVDSLVDESGLKLLTARSNPDAEGSEADSKDGKQVWAYEDRVDLHHVCGDASVYDCLHSVLKRAADLSRPYTHAVILATTANKELRMSPESRDTRMMSIMLMLKYLVALLRLPTVHIIGENALDSTSSLALVPRGADATADAPDYINVQAIYARAITQALAYPRMNCAIQQLFSQDPGSPQVVFKNVSLFVPVDREVTFAEIVQTLRFRNDCKYDICIGWCTKSGDDYRLVPPLSGKRTYDPGDRLIIVTRDERHAAPLRSSSSFLFGSLS